MNVFYMIAFTDIFINDVVLSRNVPFKHNK
jgi:hypothetical protein